MDLPRALAPWAPHLALFPRELALAIGPLVQRLDLALATPAPPTRAGRGEPDGFDGISRRGSYERLLLTEWLLADEAPDEFTRRAAMGEHAFLQPAQATPTAARTTVALFDAGPNQWGAPRIAHLAALVVLARRASAHHARFVWGLLQTPEAAWNDDITAATIRRLLGARTIREATESDLSAWRSRLPQAAENAPIDAFWIVGGKRLQPLLGAPTGSPAPLPTLLQIGESWEADARRLEARLFRAGRQTGGEILLDLPEGKVCARLLRDPFDAVAVTPTTVDSRHVPASDLLFAFGGTKLLARSATANTLLIYPIPNSVRAPTGKPKQYRSYGNEPILAAGRIGKAVVAVTATPPRTASDTAEAALRVEILSAKNRQVTTGEYPVSVRLSGPENSPDRDVLLPCLPAPDATGDLLVRTSDRILWRLHAENGNRSAKVEAMGVESVAPTPWGVAYVCRLKERRLAVTLSGDSTKSQVLHEIDPLGSRSFFGGGAHPQFGLLAYDGPNGVWTVLHKDGETLLTPPAAVEVVGVTYLPAIPGRAETPPGLVVLDSDRRSVSLIARDAAYSLPRTSSPIVRAAASPYASHIAYATEAGEVFVYSLTERELLYRSVAPSPGGEGK